MCIETKVSSGINLAKSVAATWAMMHICDNDTSGETRSGNDGENRCGQGNGLSPVM